jgi:hypothetical protein
MLNNAAAFNVSCRTQKVSDTATKFSQRRRRSYQGVVFAAKEPAGSSAKPELNQPVA